MARRSLPLGISVPDTAKRALPRMRGRDRFRFDDKDGGVRSSAGKGAGTLAGDGFALVQHVRHCSAADALALVRGGYTIQWGEPGRSARR